MASVNARSGVDDVLPAPARAAAGEAQAGSIPGANYGLFLLILTSACAQLDVAIVPYLAPYIQRAFRISDTSLSLLVGVSFALFYTLVGIPIARFIDRFSRKKILGLGMLTWTVGAVLCGFAQNFAQLFAARFVVGGGEAVNGPTAYSIMGDLFRRERLPRAIALYHIGQVSGPALAMLFSGLLMAAVIDMKPIPLPFGQMSGWQLVFIATGLPGFLIAGLMLVTMREPARRIIPNQMEKPRHGAAARSGLVHDYVLAVRYLLQHRRVFGPIFLMLLVGALNFGASAWMPIFYARTYGWAPAKLAVFQSFMSLVVVPLGMVIGVVLAERFTRNKREDAPVLVLIIGRCLSLTGIFVPLMPSPWLALGLSSIGFVALGMSGPIQNVQMQTVTPAELRGKITALYLFLLNVIGIALSPIIVAVLTDYVFRDPAMVRWSIFCLLAFSSPLAFFFVLTSRTPFVEEVRRLKQLEAAAGVAA